MYIRGLIPRNFAELADAVPIDMSSRVLLNLLNSLRKSDKMRGLPSNLLFFFATILIKLIIQNSIKITLKSHF